jgi:hypothetical protein
MSELRQMPPQQQQPQPQAAPQPMPQQQPPQMQQGPPTDPRVQQALSAPVPGQSLTTTPGNAPWERPPQYNDVKTALNYLADQITEPNHTKDLLFLFKNGICIEEVVRTVLFAGFQSGKWTMDTALLLYRPLMMLLIAISYRAKLKDTKILMGNNFNQNNMAKIKMVASELTQEPMTDTTQTMPPQQGFMSRGT